MYPIALVCMGLQVIVSFAVGMRLMALARRTGQFPELALSLGTLLLPALGYPSLMVAVLLEGLGLPGVVPVFFVGLSLTLVAVSMNYFFTWRVFRPGTAWAAILCGIGTWLLVGPAGGVAAHVAAASIDAGIRSADGWTLPIVSAALAAFGWAGLESFLYYRNARRRLRLGLLEAAVCNRFLLWALASAAWFGLTALAAFLLKLGVNPMDHDAFTLGLGVTGLLNSVCMVLCFMPPARYLDWLQRPASSPGRP